MPTDIKIESSSGKTLTPTMPKEPPAEIKAMEFKMPDEGLFDNTDSTVKIDGQEVKITPASDDSRNTKPVEQIVEEKKTEDKVTPPTSKEEKKVETKSVLKPPTEEKKTEFLKEVDKSKSAEVKTTSTIKPITPKEKKEEQDTFDYTKYAPQEQTNLKNMSRQSREFTAKLIDENKQLSALKDANYLQHEQGYTLSPEFRELQVNNYKAQIEGQCWEKSLLDIKAGKDFQEIVGFDKDNNPILSHPKKATDRDEIRINNNMGACINASRQFEGKLQEFPNQFKGRINQDLQIIQQVQKERFAWHQDPKLLDYSVNVEGKGDIKLRDVKSDFKNMWPVYLQNNPAVDVAADMFVAMQIQGAELREALNSKQVSQIENEEIKRGEPSSDSREVVAANINPLIPKTFSLGENAHTLGIG